MLLSAVECMAITKICRTSVLSTVQGMGHSENMSDECFFDTVEVMCNSYNKNMSALSC